MKRVRNAESQEPFKSKCRNLVCIAFKLLAYLCRGYKFSEWERMISKWI